MKGRKIPGHNFRFCMCVHCIGRGERRKFAKKEARKADRRNQKKIMESENEEFTSDKNFE